jgi:polyhydroxybutyrate depolymerase
MGSIESSRHQPFAGVDRGWLACQDATRVRVRAILGLSAALVVACSGGPAASPTASSPPAAEPSASLAASRPPDVVIGGDRPVAVHVPASYDPARPAPLLILLHGYGSSGRDHDAYFHLGAAAEQRGFLYAYPDGTTDSTGNRFWSATDACCDFDRTGVNDVVYLDNLITAIQASFAVDPKRIDLIGHSNGGFMSYRLACAHGDRIAALVSLAGATFANPADCAPIAPVAVLQIHGTADDVIEFKGGTIEGIGSGRLMSSYPGPETTVTTWATYDGCGATPSVLDEHVDVDADLSDAGSPAEASVTRWTGCKPGGAVELWTMPGGGHDPTISASFPDAALDFLQAHPKP